MDDPMGKLSLYLGGKKKIYYWIPKLINMFNPPGTPFLPAHPLEECHTILTKGDFLHVIFIPKTTS